MPGRGEEGRIGVTEGEATEPCTTIAENNTIRARSIHHGIAQDNNTTHERAREIRSNAQLQTPRAREPPLGRVGETLPPTQLSTPGPLLASSAP